MGAVFRKGSCASIGRAAFVGLYLALPVDRERLGSLGNWSTFEVPGFPMNQGDRPVL